MSNKRKKVITVRTDGKPDLELAAVLLAPLFLKIHERNSVPSYRVYPKA